MMAEVEVVLIMGIIVCFIFLSILCALLKNEQRAQEDLRDTIRSLSAQLNEAVAAETAVNARYYDILRVISKSRTMKDLQAGMRATYSGASEESDGDND